MPAKSHRFPGGEGAERARTLLRGAQMITMAPGRPDVERVDIHVGDDRIADTGDHLDGHAVETVTIPGLVNAHLAICQSGLRAHVLLAGDVQGTKARLLESGQRLLRVLDAPSTAQA
ncbi:hypothetical protein HLK59_02025 [Streptomyces sp. S3(2020)]|uniref:hypothetical protein n=1 Tax=Streptomyces sp. S3(2020) TaxID=2732044 RepID=UPI0014889563|nr:hypothetical protein [Streptomyces sp. S3(2020)]NNN29149.1 hypothetical protein [Streptomyces sp. S3(2020)]